MLKTKYIKTICELYICHDLCASISSFNFICYGFGHIVVIRSSILYLYMFFMHFSRPFFSFFNRFCKLQCYMYMNRQIPGVPILVVGCDKRTHCGRTTFLITFAVIFPLETWSAGFFCLQPRKIAPVAVCIWDCLRVWVSIFTNCSIFLTTF